MINCHSMLRNINLFLLYQSRNGRVLKWGFFMNEYRVQCLHLGVFLEIGKNYLETLSYLDSDINILDSLIFWRNWNCAYILKQLLFQEPCMFWKIGSQTAKKLFCLWRLDSSISPFSFLCSFSQGCQMVSASVFHNKYC